MSPGVSFSFLEELLPLMWEKLNEEKVVKLPCSLKQVLGTPAEATLPSACAYHPLPGPRRKACSTAPILRFS